jgi:hypothetical protein
MILIPQRDGVVKDIPEKIESGIGADSPYNAYKRIFPRFHFLPPPCALFGRAELARSSSIFLYRWFYVKKCQGKQDATGWSRAIDIIFLL